MPEGPEIRLAADSVASVLEKKKIVEVFFGLPKLEAFKVRLEGATVTAVDTHGKAMLTRFDNGLTIYSHNQLYGRWYTGRRDEPPETGRSLRMALLTRTDGAWLYSASDIEVLTEADLAEHPFLSRAGPDVLDPSLDVDTLDARLQLPEFERRSLGSLYLDQGFLAGIGNYLRSEILHRAGLHPAMRPVDLDAPDRRRLARESLAVSRRSYRTRGVTVTSALQRKLRASGQSRRAYRFWVFGRDGKPCRDCGASIQRMDVGGRGFFWCPRCQPGFLQERG